MLFIASVPVTSTTAAIIMETLTFLSTKSNSQEPIATIDVMNRPTSTVRPTPSLQHYNSLLSGTY